jgi:hypothetical protein
MAPQQHHKHSRHKQRLPQHWSVHKKAKWEANRLGIRGEQWLCLESLVVRENGESPPSWNPRKWNGSGSSAYGLPQALPGSKMASEGGDWSWNPRTQIRWLIRYSKERYGSVCNANSFQWAHNYY